MSGAGAKSLMPNWSRLRVMALAHFTNDLYAAFLAPLLPLLVGRFDLSLTLAGLLGTVFNTASAFSQPFFGLAADRISRPGFTVLGATVTATAMGMLGLAPTYSLLVVLLVVAGLGTGSFHPQSFAVVGSASGTRLGTGMSIFVAGGEFGYALGPLYAAVVVGAVGLAGTAVAAAPGLLACLVLWRLTSGWEITTERPAERLRADLWRNARSLLLIWTVVVIRSVIILSHILFLPLLLSGRGHSLIVGGAAVFLFGGIGAIGGLVGGTLSDMIGRRAVMAISLGLSVPLLLAFDLIQSIWGLVPLALGGVVLYLAAPVSIVMAQEMLPARASFASSLVTGVAWGSAGLTLTIVGALADRIGLSTTLVATLVLSIPGMAAIWFLPKTPLRSQTSPR